MPPRRKPSPTTLIPPEEGFLRLHDVLRLFPVGETSWRRGIADGRYPPPVKLGPRMKAWRVSAIRELLRSISEKA